MNRPKSQVSVSRWKFYQIIEIDNYIVFTLYYIVITFLQYINTMHRITIMTISSTSVISHQLNHFTHHSVGAEIR